MDVNFSRINARQNQNFSSDTYCGQLECTNYLSSIVNYSANSICLDHWPNRYCFRVVSIFQRMANLFPQGSKLGHNASKRQHWFLDFGAVIRIRISELSYKTTCPLVWGQLHVGNSTCSINYANFTLLSGLKHPITDSQLSLLNTCFLCLSLTFTYPASSKKIISRSSWGITTQPMDPRAHLTQDFPIIIPLTGSRLLFRSWLDVCALCRLIQIITEPIVSSLWVVSPEPSLSPTPMCPFVRIKKLVITSSREIDSFAALVASFSTWSSRCT